MRSPRIWNWPARPATASSRWCFKGSMVGHGSAGARQRRRGPMADGKRHDGSAASGTAPTAPWTRPRAVGEGRGVRRLNPDGFESSRGGHGNTKRDVTETRRTHEKETQGNVDDLITSDKPVVFAFHACPWSIHRLTCRRTNHEDIHVRGYKFVA